MQKKKSGVGVEPGSVGAMGKSVIQEATRALEQLTERRYRSVGGNKEKFIFRGDCKHALLRIFECCREIRIFELFFPLLPS